MIRVINPGSFSIKSDDFPLKADQPLAGGDNKIEAIAIRVVCGGKFSQPMPMNDDLLNEINKLASLAPLHNSAVLQISERWSRSNPEVRQIAVFDCEFFNDLPAITKYYALPIEFQDKYGIRRMGFHGLSHESALIQTAGILAKPINGCNLITIHLGQGSSITAIQNGKPIDTSMGFTPMEGLVMGTRSGDIDPGILLYLLELNKMPAEINSLLNDQSGWYGLCGEKDFHSVILKANLDPQAKLALDMAVYRIQKYIGAYWFALKGKVDALVFTGKIGADSEIVRNLVIKDIPDLKDVRILHVEAKENELIYEKAKKVLGT